MEGYHKTYELRAGNYSYRSFSDAALPDIPAAIPVQNGQSETLGDTALTEVEAETAKDFGMLMRRDEEIEVSYEGKETLKAPVKAGTQVGTITYRVGGQTFLTCPVKIRQSVKKIDFPWCLERPWTNGHSAQRADRGALYNF